MESQRSEVTHPDAPSEVWTLDTSATLTKDVVPVGIGISNGEKEAGRIDPESRIDPHWLEEKQTS